EAPPDLAEPPPEAGFTVTDGRRAWTVAVAPGRQGPILVLDGDLPPPATELWVVRRSAALGRDEAGPQAASGLADGTRIATPGGPRPVEEIAPGDPVLTVDDGAMPVLWVGRQTISWARLRLRPGLRPVRLPAAAATAGGAGGPLRVAPRQGVRVAGRAVAAAFGAREALVAAADLPGGWPAGVDHGLATVTYVQLMFARHELVLAEGIAVASFHPGLTPAALPPAAGRAGLEIAWPGLAADPDRFGPPVRRTLSRAEAAILAHRRPPLG
ncbi:MAG: Hint domain-containing protein, partial [Rhodobacteraceae bacterium]|nr:Hint domain-containing protein [Paracoccaceae bacterium]